MCTYMILYGRYFATTSWATDNARISLIWWYPFMSILCIVDACYQIATGVWVYIEANGVVVGARANGVIGGPKQRRHRQ